MLFLVFTITFCAIDEFIGVSLFQLISRHVDLSQTQWISGSRFFAHVHSGAVDYGLHLLLSGLRQ